MQSPGATTVFEAANRDRLRIVPGRGGLVTGWLCHGPWGAREMLYFDEQRFADPAKSVRGGIPVLFPICGSLAGSALPQHGFARDLPWEITALADGAGVRMSVEDTPQTRAVFPHRFALELEYLLEPQALSILARVSNRGEAELPFSFGLHPYFAVPDPGAVRLSGLPDEAVDQTSGRAGAAGALLDDLTRGVDVLAGPAATVRAVAGDVAITLETQPPLDLIVIWTDPPRPMVCVEPWTSPRGALASGERLLHVSPAGSSVELRCRFRVTAR
jgi:galactose mutarotase-like enzyme